jgi:alpha-L-fucosidase
VNKPTFPPDELDWTPLKREAPQWFRDAKFGLFFHWGPYCVPAFENEWYSRNMYAKGLSQNLHHVETYGPLSEFGYKEFYDGFTGERFDPEAWADLIADSGARYAAPVAEHADNFSLWDSKINPINSVNYGPKRDVVGELSQAIKGRGLRFAATFHHSWLWGWFMSTDPEADVYNPANEKYYGRALPLEAGRYIPWQMPDEKFNQVWLQKVREVIDSYDPDLVYFDSRTAIIDERTRMEMLRHCYEGASGRKDRVVTYKQQDLPEGTGVLDVERGRFSVQQPFVWQTDDRLEDRVTWCHVKEPRYRSATAIIHQLCEVVSKNGNLLLNVGPRVDGTFEQEAVDRLHEVGAWLSEYGEAIYGTRPFTVYGEGSANTGDAGYEVSKIEEQTRDGVEKKDDAGALNPGDVRFTTRDEVVYAIVPFSQDLGTLRLTSLGDRSSTRALRIRRIDVIGGPQDVPWKRDARALAVEIGGRMPSPHANVIKISTSAPS